MKHASDGQGALFFESQVPNSIVHSVWIGPTDHTQPPMCRDTVNFLGNLQDADDYNGDGAVSFAYADAAGVVRKRSGGGARVVIAIDGLTPGHSYSVRGVAGQCGDPVGNRYFRINLAEGVASAYASKTVDLGQEELDSLRSLRVVDTSTHFTWGCVALSIVAVVVA